MLLWAGLVMVIVVAGAVGGFALWLDGVGDVAELLPAAEVSYRMDPATRGTIEIDGLLTPATASIVERMMKGPPWPVATLRVRSNGGGGNGAERLARLANAAGLQVRVEDRAICSSACVIFLAQVRPELRRVAPGAWLRVHGRSTGPDDPRDREKSTVMDEWVGMISPAWLRFLEGCRSKPLVRDAGIAMTWAEVEAVGRGPAAVDCDAIGHRTKDWLFGARS